MKQNRTKKKERKKETSKQTRKNRHKLKGQTYIVNLLGDCLAKIEVFTAWKGVFVPLWHHAENVPDW